MNVDQYAARNKRLDKEIAWLEKVQAADINPRGRMTKKVQANTGRRA